MTKWQPIKFADVNVGDKIKSVSPCGTVRVGVVVDIANAGRPYDRDDRCLAEPSWTLYRRAPKFTPQDVPAVGQWIEATLRDGRVETFQVAAANVVPSGSFARIYDAANEYYYLDLKPRNDKEPKDIIAWTPTTPPAPEEPSGLGAVVRVKSMFLVRIHPDDIGDIHVWQNSYGHTWNWASVVDDGPVTVLSQGVTR